MLKERFVMRLFADRADAGRKLAASLRSHRAASPVVVGLPRGGVVVAYEVARTLDAPLDVCVARKMRAPAQSERAIGAVSEDGAIHVDLEATTAVGVDGAQLASMVAAKRAEVEEGARRFRRGAPPIDVRGRTVIVVDDGIATGDTALAAVQTLRIRGAARIVLAAPVGPASALEELGSFFDELVCLHPEHAFYTVRQWYADFTPTSDDDVVALLDRARAERPPARRAS